MRQNQSDKRLYKLIKDAPGNESDKSLKKRYLKSTFYFGVFKLMKYKLVQGDYEQECTDEELYVLNSKVVLRTV